MTKINPISFNNENPINPTSTEQSPKETAIFNFDDQNPVENGKPPYVVKFDKDGYPIPDGETLSLTPKGTILFGLIKTGGEYTYIANGSENIGEIKAKFHLRDGAIRRCNPNIRDDYWKPDAGRKIYFMQDDIDTQRK